MRNEGRRVARGGYGRRLSEEKLVCNTAGRVEVGPRADLRVVLPTLFGRRTPWWIERASEPGDLEAGPRIVRTCDQDLSGGQAAVDHASCVGMCQRVEDQQHDRANFRPRGL